LVSRNFSRFGNERQFGRNEWHWKVLLDRKYSRANFEIGSKILEIRSQRLQNRIFRKHHNFISQIVAFSTDFSKCENIRPKTAILEWNFNGSSDPSHFIFEIIVGKSRIRHTTTQKMCDEFLRHSNSESFYAGSDSFRQCFQTMKWLWSGLPLSFNLHFLTLQVADLHSQPWSRLVASEDLPWPVIFNTRVRRMMLWRHS